MPSQLDLPSIDSEKQQPFAKGVGVPSDSLNITGAVSVKGGHLYEPTHFGINTVAIMLTEQCSISINQSPMFHLPERVSLNITTITGIIFNKTTIVATLK